MNDLIQMGVLSCIAIACALVGPFLVLKRLTMFANSLSHTVLLGIAISFLLLGGSLFNISNLLLGALIAALLTALLTSVLIRFLKLQEDASVGLVFTALFALGIICVTLYTKNVHIGIESVMGNVDLLQGQDLILSAFLAGLNLLVITLFFRQFQLSSFDQNFAKVLKMPNFFHLLLLVLTSITCVGAFRAIGVLLVLAFLVGPYLTARIFCHRLSKLLFFSPMIGVFASITGVLLSRFFYEAFGMAVSTGGLVSSLVGLIYLLAKCFSSLKSKHAEKNLAFGKHRLHREEYPSGCKTPKV